ncbi:flavin-containing monooxygenase 5-like isoform X5 [Labeo rohita]|uniref:flavin-containing monooxygenase 5-like isoform X4 n=1 Tax=Labeo rohita TaxID=84645 RepID=UPI0021E271D7|nr:flavin-containing monooxygenase 5-like isoform X4 [Labeo rohita]XP_050994040.1 flavin-containing monooxygenase 5-like isoform X5 [Labeo rohita]
MNLCPLFSPGVVVKPSYFFEVSNRHPFFPPRCFTLVCQVIMAKRVAVIGGGTSGLACIKCCLDEGLEPVCFETSDDIGGLWRFKESPDPDRASIYHSLIINTSKEMMCFSDFPIPSHFPNYMHNSLIMDYFRMYADHFQLKRHIHFQTKVLHVTPRPDFPHSGQWDIETESKDGQREKQVFDAVMICTGHHCHPHFPLQDFPGINTFKGKFFHSRDYKNPEEWRGKRVVVIGIGNSGGDIAVELSRMAKQVYLSTRRGSWIVNRVGDKGVPSDMIFNRRALKWFLRLLPVRLLNKWREKQLNKRFNHKLYGLQPAHRVFSQHPTLNDDLPNRILSGTVSVKTNVQEFRGSSVVFEDGTVEDDIDLVVFATGYTFSFPFLSSHVIPVSKNKVSLYKYVYPPGLEQQTLAVIGLIQPLGAIMPISEMQARWATRVFKGLCKLPPVSAMMKDIKAKEEAMARRYVAAQRHTIQVDYIPYMDELAKQVGVRPPILKLLLTDPTLAVNVIFGPCTPYQFRLHGPGQWEGARQAILTQWDRVAVPLKTRCTPEPQSQRSSHSLIFSVCVAALLSALYYSRDSLQALIADPSSLLDKIRAFVPVPLTRQ